MGRPLVGWEGRVTSWGADATTDTECATLLAAIGANNIVVNSVGPPDDNTVASSSLTAAASQPGIKSWTATIAGMLAGFQGPTQIGIATDGSEYVVHPRAFNLQISRAAFPIHEPEAGREWAEFAPDIYEISGGFEFLVNNGVDDDLVVPPSFGAALSGLTFTYKTGHTIAFDGFYNSLGYTNPVRGMQTANYGVRGSGQATFAGASSPLFAAGALGAPFWDEDNDNTFKGTEAVVALNGSKTLTGKMFWTSIALQGSADSATRVTIQTQGNGALAVA